MKKRFYKLGKKGSHVGVVLSFLIFITFLLFLQALLIEPAINQENKKSILDNLKLKVIENSSVKLTSVTINIDNNTNQNCVKFENFITKIGIENNIVVKNKDGEIQNSYMQVNDLWIDRNDDGDIFFKVYYSEGFGELSSGGGGCKKIKDNELTIGLISTERYIFETEIGNLIEYYNTNYSSLKEEYGILEGNEFGFDFKYINGTTISTTEKSFPGNVYATEITTQYIDEDVNILFGKISIKVW